MLTFNSIDVETANADLASICQIGVVQVRNGEIADQWQSLINPEDWFDPRNVGIHGIDEHDVSDSPTLPEVRDELRHRLQGSVLVSHMAFDRVAFDRAMTRYKLEQLQVTWLDSATIARRTWPDRYGRRGYGLKNISNDLGISLKHHDALEDARAAAQIVLCACAISATDIQGWLERTARPVSRRSSTRALPERREGNAEGTLHGETVVFTGALAVSRREAADLAARAGCNVVPSVTQNITMIVVGVQNKNRLGGYEKSSKQRKAEALIEQGLEIRILSDHDFCELVDLDAQSQE